ncbi:hypothetical protein CSA08_01340 [Candidatus Gracilibacteria bacterium]|nr:MAG: hypothetical protein CSA08_01340 [Candidatus Gracilibacteria bacterium]
MDKIEVTCSSVETAITKKASNIFLRHLLNSLDLDNVDDIMKIYNKLKSFRSVSLDESELLYGVVKSKDFKKMYNNESDGKLKFSRNNEKRFSYSNFLISLTKLITIGDIQHLLIKNSELEYGGNLYRRIIYFNNSKEKQKFCQVINDDKNFLTAIDLKTGKTFVLDKLSNEIVLISKDDILLNHVYDRVLLPDTFFYAETGDSNTKNIIFPGGSIEFSKNSYVYVGLYALYVFDTDRGILTKIEKKNYDIQERDVSFIDKIIPKGQMIVTFLHHLDDETKEITDEEVLSDEILNDGKKPKNLAKTDLFNLELNKNIIENISEEYIYTNGGNYIICASSDLGTIYLVDAKSGDVTSFSSDEFLQKKDKFNDKSWKYIISDIKKQFS